MQKKFVNTLHQERRLFKEKVKAEVKKETRDRKIDSILEGIPFKEMKIEEHPLNIEDRMIRILINSNYGASVRHETKNSYK